VVERLRCIGCGLVRDHLPSARAGSIHAKSRNPPDDTKTLYLKMWQTDRPVGDGESGDAKDLVEI